MEYRDGVAIETVLMLYPNRATVCISTQAGCAMGCPFCATGQAGFQRQLSAGEVIRQVMVADAVLRTGELSAAVDVAGDDRFELPTGHPARVTNVVFMGMGEPMANMPATLATIDYLHERLGLSARNITVSTVGLVPAMRRLANHGKPVTLAVSLHASDDALRDDLVPVNRQHPLAAVEAAMEEYRAATNRRVSIEWCLIGDVNDSEEQAIGLARIARRTRSHVNVIPMNPTPGVRWKEPDDAVDRTLHGDARAPGCQRHAARHPGTRCRRRLRAIAGVLHPGGGRATAGGGWCGRADRHPPRLPARRPGRAG